MLLLATSTEIGPSVFWDMSPCGFVCKYNFVGACCLHFQGSLLSWITHMMEAPGSAKMSVLAYQSTQHHMLSHIYGVVYHYVCFEATETVMDKAHF